MPTKTPTGASKARRASQNRTSATILRAASACYSSASFVSIRRWGKSRERWPGRFCSNAICKVLFLLHFKLLHDDAGHFGILHHAAKKNAGLGGEKHAALSRIVRRSAMRALYERCIQGDALRAIVEEQL